MDRDDPILCAARIIAGGTPPPQLHEWLLLCAAGISQMIGRERRQPGRAELRERFWGVIRAARLIERELTDPAVRGLLVDDDGAALELNRKREHHDLAERTSAAVKRIPVGPGQHKHYARPKGQPPQIACALAVAVAWEKVRGTFPGKDNINAQSACNTLWAIAGGDAERRGSSSFAIWRNNLWRAREQRNSPIADGLREDLATHLGGQSKGSKNRDLTHGPRRARATNDGSPQRKR